MCVSATRNLPSDWRTSFGESTIAPLCVAGGHRSVLLLGKKEVTIVVCTSNAGSLIRSTSITDSHASVASGDQINWTFDSGASELPELARVHRRRREVACRMFGVVLFGMHEKIGMPGEEGKSSTFNTCEELCLGHTAGHKAPRLVVTQAVRSTGTERSTDTNKKTSGGAPEPFEHAHPYISASQTPASPAQQSLATPSRVFSTLLEVWYCAPTTARVGLSLLWRMARSGQAFAGPSVVSPTLAPGGRASALSTSQPTMARPITPPTLSRQSEPIGSISVHQLASLPAASSPTTTTAIAIPTAADNHHHGPPPHPHPRLFQGPPGHLLLGSQLRHRKRSDRPSIP
ncbi:hypothetical protein DFH27DRAFT_618177 [Peziza echinospora]|nr:hypothetical protein DFH27DRAFT_618177 [Peziza echinospora]